MRYNNAPIARDVLTRRHEPSLGIFLYSGDTSLAEAAALLNIQFIVIDMEASPLPDQQALHVLQALKATEYGVLVRIPRHDKHLIGHALDMGAGGVMVPHVDSAADARRLVVAYDYPPAGTRGSNALRASDYGLRATAELTEAGQRGLCIFQVESQAALPEIGEIADVEGVDGLFIGTADLALSLGVSPDSTEMKAVRRAVIDVCSDRGRIPGIFAYSAAAAAEYMDEGFQLVALGNEVRLFMAGLSAMLTSVGRAPMRLE